MVDIDKFLRRTYLHYKLGQCSKPEVTPEQIVKIESSWSPDVKNRISKIQNTLNWANYNRRLKPKRKKHKKRIADNYWSKYAHIRHKPRLLDTWQTYTTRYSITDPILPQWPTYKDYCNSSWFKNWEYRILRKYKNICQLCGKLASIAHHLKYRKWGTEKITDGIAVCHNCHEIIHNSKKLDFIKKIA